MKLSIRWKLILSIGLPLAAIYLTVLAIDYHKLREAAYAQTESYLSEYVSHQAAKISGEFSTAAQIARSTASFMSLNANITENKIYEILRSNVLQDPLVYGSCIAFEPNAFDAQKRLFAPMSGVIRV